MRVPSLARWLALGMAGPALIVVSILAVLHDFAFGGMAPSQQNDVLAFWLPNHCLLGQSLVAGNIPEWNPHVLAGVPMAADPQSGWMYLPAMLLYTVLPCDAALPAFIVLQPLIAGLGMYWFLRSEGLARGPATIGGLAISLAIAASRTTVSLPVSASVAWSAVLLALASRALRATSWGARIGWVTLAGLAWGQLAGAHLSHGLVIGTVATVLFGIARSVADVRAGRRTAGEALAVGALFLAVLVPLNLAVLLPRFGYLSRSTLGIGYDELRELTIRFSGHVPPQVFPRATGGYGWPLTFATSPGSYLGAAPLMLSITALWSRRHRPLTVAAAVLGIGSYLLSLPGVARAVAPAVRAVPFGDVYLHAPSRLRYGLLLAIPVMAGVGVDAWIRNGPGRRWWAALVPGLLLWVALPAVVGVGPANLALVAVGAVVGVGLLGLGSRRPAVLAALPVVVAVELSTGALAGQAASTEVVAAPSVREVAWRTPFENLLEPDVDPGDYVTAGPVARTLQTQDGARYLTLQPEREARAQGYVGPWQPGDGPLLDNQRAMLFGLEDAQGYNPVQPIRFWSFSRRANPAPPKYNVTVFPDPSPAILDLLHVEWVIGARTISVEGFEPVRFDGPWALFRGPDRPRASVLSSWTVATSPHDAIFDVTSPRFDPAVHLILDRDPGVPGPPPGAPGGTAVYRALGPEEASVTTEASAPGMLLVRNGWDPHWRATVDGRAAPVLIGNTFLQAIPVPAGSHVVELRYHDPSVRIGLLGSGLTLAALVAAAAVARRRDRRGGPTGSRLRATRRRQRRGDGGRLR